MRRTRASGCLAIIDLSLRREFTVQVGGEGNGTTRGIVGDGGIARGSHLSGNVANETPARDGAFGLCLQEAVLVVAVAIASGSSNVRVERIKVDIKLLSGGSHVSHDEGGDEATKHGGGGSHPCQHLITTATVLAFPRFPIVDWVC